MGDEQMPDDRLKGLAVRRDVTGVHYGHDHAGVGHLCRIATVLADDSDDSRADLLRELEGEDEVGKPLYSEKCKQYLLLLRPLN